MSEEQVTKNEKKCNCCVFKALSVIALLLSIAALTLSGLMYSGKLTVNTPSAGGEVKISTQYDKGKSLEKALATKKPVIVFFYTDWCGFCQRFIKTYDAVTKDKQIKKNFAVAYVNCEKPENSKIMQEYGVQGFPTVFVINKDREKIQLENNTFFNDDSKDVIVKNAMAYINGESKEEAKEETKEEKPAEEAK